MARYTVLYVDDEPDLLVLGKAFLESTGDFTIDTLSSAMDGLAALRVHSYDAVISDYLMPEMDGLDFLKAVREEFGTMPFILFTGRGREDVVIEAINNGVDFYLQKGGETKAQFAELAHKINMAVLRKQAVEEQTASEKRLSTIFHASPIHQIITEYRTGKIIDINDRFLSDLKLSRGDVMGKTLEELGFFFDPSQYAAIMKQLERGEVVRNTELLVKERDGRTFITLSSLSRVKVHDQDLVYTQSMDISAQSKAKQTIDALLNAPPDVQMLLDTGGKIMAANHAASARYHMPLHDLIGADAYMLTSPDFASRRHGWIGEVLADRQPHAYTDSQTGRIYENNLYPVLDSTGSVSAVAVYSHDATDEVGARQALKESEEKYRLLVEHSHDAVYIYRGSEILFINRMAEQITGYSHNELMGMNIWDLVHPDDRDRLKTSATRRFSGEQVSSAFYARIVTKDGKVRDGEFYVDLVEYLGTPSILGIFRDITEKKRAQDELTAAYEQLAASKEELQAQFEALKDGQALLLESEEKYRTLVEHTEEGVFVAQDGKLVFVNEMLANGIGYTSDELIGHSFAHVVAPEDREMLLSRHFSRLSGSTPPDDYEFSLLHKDQTTRFRVRIRVGTGTYQGRPAVIGTLHDVTEERKREAALTESEARFRGLSEYSIDTIMLFDRDLRHVYVNPMAERISGIKVEQWIGKTHTELKFPEPLVRLWQGALHQVFTTGKTNRLEFQLPSTGIWIDWVLVPVIGPDGTVTEVIASARDITERKQAEEALARSEELHRKMILTIPDIIVMSDLEGIITFVNDKVLELAGETDRDAIIGKSMFSFFAPECLPLARKNTLLMFERPLGPVEYIFIKKTGERVNLEVNGAVLRRPDCMPYGLIFICRDITERLQAEEALRQSEELHRSLITASPDGIAMLDLKGNLTYVSPRALEMFELSDARDAIGTNVLGWIAEADRDLAMKRFHEIQTQQVLINHIYRMVRKDGSFFDVEMHSAILHDKKEAVTGIISILRDITERRRTETALQESEEKYRSLVTRTFDAVVVYQEGTIVLANDAAARIVGYRSGDELAGKPIIRFIHPDSRPIVIQRQKQMLETPDKVVPLIPEKFVHADGTPIDVEVMASATRFEGKLAIQVIFRDISERKRAETALRASEENYRRIIENMQDVFYRTDKDGTLTMISKFGAHLVGFNSADEIIGHYKATDFYAFPKERDEMLSGLMQEKSVNGYPLTLVDRHGRHHSATASSRILFDEEGNYCGVEGILHDVTALKEVENALRQANRQITLMTSITRHDIHNQLLALNGWLELSCASLDDPGRTRELIKKAQNIADIIGQQINFTTFFDHIGITPPSWQEPAPLVEKARDALPFNAVEVVVDLQGIEICADPLLEKVFYNLLDNSLRYGGPSLTTIRVAAHEKATSLIITVEDNGRGIEKQYKKRLFDRGFGQNTGLGLFLAREVLSITGLSIRETGTYTKGARFEIVVPAGKYRVKSPL